MPGKEFIKHFTDGGEPAVGRPLIELDKKLFENLCQIHCTREDISGVFEITEKTLNEWCKRTYFDEDGNPMNFSQVRKLFQGKGNASLRKAQFKYALRGNPQLLKWLGIQYLGQRDKVETTNTIYDGDKALEELNKALDELDKESEE